MNQDPVTVLVIDDTEENRYTISRYLARAGLKVLEAGSGREGLERLKEKPDVVLLDVRLPDIMGFDVCRIIKSDPATSSIPVLHTSASFTKSGDKAHGLESGADGYLAAPFEPEELLATIRALVRARKAEAAAKISEEHYRTLLDALPQLVWTAEPNGSFDFTSQQWADYTGSAPESQIGSGWLEAVHPLDRDRLREGWEEATRTGQEWNAEARLIGSGARERWFQIRAVPLRGDNREITKWFGSCTDITANVEAREVLMSSSKELERLVAERTLQLRESVQELEAFCYTIAHDLRAPLRAMQGFSKALLEDYSTALGSEGTDFAARIAASSVRMDMLITDLLDYSRLSRLALEPSVVQLEEAVQSTLELHADEISKKGAMITVARPLPAVRVHKVILEHTLSNLLGNALKFVPAGVPPEISFFAENRGALTRLSVRDNGIGIAPEHHARIFQIFERLSGQGVFTGTGIGLAIVRKCMEKVGGAVGVNSEPGRGSEFWIEVPSAT